MAVSALVGQGALMTLCQEQFSVFEFYWCFHVSRWYDIVHLRVQVSLGRHPCLEEMKLLWRHWPKPYFSILHYLNVILLNATLSRIANH